MGVLTISVEKSIYKEGNIGCDDDFKYLHARCDVVKRAIQQRVTGLRDYSALVIHTLMRRFMKWNYFHIYFVGISSGFFTSAYSDEMLSPYFKFNPKALATHVVKVSPRFTETLALPVGLKSMGGCRSR